MLIINSILPFKTIARIALLSLLVFSIIAGKQTIAADSAVLANEKLKADAEAQTIDTDDNIFDDEEPDLYLEWSNEDDEPDYKIYKKVNVENPCDRGLDSYNYEKEWYDESQIYINSSFCEPALWFDNFFGNDRLVEEGVAGTYVRWRNDFTLDEEDNFEYKPRFTASVQLPGISDKLSLVFDDEDESLRDITPGGSQAESNSTFGLQVNVNETARSKFTAKVSFSPKLLLRYRYTYPYTNNIILRLTQELERNKAVNSSRTRFDYENTLDDTFVLRSSTEGKLSEEYDGVDWLQSFVLFQRLSKKSSLAYETSVNGVTKPRELELDYRLAIRYRRNFHREWLFYEIAPEYTWPITLDENRQDIEIERRSKFLFFVRLEIHFGNASKKRYEQYNTP